MMNAAQILNVLDKAVADFTFPMLDNGYVYPAASRLSLYRSAVNWALVVEIFGYSPRSGLPDTNVTTFGEDLRNRKSEEDYLSRAAFEAYLAAHPHAENIFVFPVEEGPWQDEDDSEVVATGASSVVVRGRALPIPRADEYKRLGIALMDRPRVQVFELCRAIAATHRDLVLATPQERRTNVAPELRELLVADEWHHPDVAGSERPSGSETFQQLARVLETGDAGHYAPTKKPNSHWRHWPEAGTL